MGLPIRPLPVKLVLGLIYACEGRAQGALSAMSESFGAIDMECSPFPFDFTAYYEKEMGSSLMRKFVSFASLIPRTLLPEVKLLTNSLERELRSGTGQRTVNLDPGYLSSDSLILATTKAYAHRPYLRDGIYAELTYRYRKGSFIPLEWTYPDYRETRSINFFNHVRRVYMKQLASLKGQGG